MQLSRTHNATRDLFVFVVFCAIVFSKVVWFDLRVYAATEDRRLVLTLMFIPWVLGQLVCYLILLRALLKNITLPVLAWGALILPYFVVGLMANGISSYTANDLARYALPLGWLVVFNWALKNFSAKQIIATIFSVLLVAVLVRLAAHEALNDGRIRYGRHWEIWLLSALIVFAAWDRRWWMVAVIAGCAFSLCAVFWTGNTRAVLLGSATVAIATVALIALFWPTRASVGRASIVGSIVVIACAYALSPFAPSDRLNISNSFAEPDSAVEETQPEGQSLIDEAREKWIDAVSSGDMTLRGRFWEATYFLSRTFGSNGWILGAGAGTFERIEVNENPRDVRGAHVTPVTIIYRHGLFLGTAIIVLLAYWTVKGSVLSARNGGDIGIQALGLTLLAYALTIFPLSLLHQGVFDDPLIFLAVALATSKKRRISPDMDDHPPGGPEKKAPDCL